MQRKIRRRPRLEAKYKTRRATLILLLLVVLGAAIWLIGFQKPSPDTEEEASMAESSSQAEESSKPSSKMESQSELEEETESQSEPESQPEPEPQPISVSQDGNWNLLLVNSTSPLPNDFAVELETITDIYRVDVRIADSVRRMFNKAKEDGITLTICSAYRSPEKQEQLFSNQVQSLVNQGKTKEEAATITATNTARPGTSEHHTGLALDIVTPDYMNLDDGYAATPAAQWLAAHAVEYGFVLRFPKNKQEITGIIFEPWHYRYVGLEHAAAIKADGLCLEEYVARLEANHQARPPESDETSLSEAKD